MTVIRNSVVVRTSCEAAFDYLSDHRAELDWNPKCEMMEKITEGPVGQGTRYRAKWTGSPLVELETVHYDRPHTWIMHNDGLIEVTFTCRLEPVPAGTQLSVEFEPRPHSWMRLVFPLFLRRIRNEERANMTHLRVALERRVNPARDQARHR